MIKTYSTYCSQRVRQLKTVLPIKNVPRCISSTSFIYCHTVSDFTSFFQFSAQNTRLQVQDIDRLRKIQNTPLPNACADTTIESTFGSANIFPMEAFAEPRRNAWITTSCRSRSRSNFGIGSSNRRRSSSNIVEPGNNDDLHFQRARLVGERKAFSCIGPTLYNYILCCLKSVYLIIFKIKIQNFIKKQLFTIILC